MDSKGEEGMVEGMKRGRRGEDMHAGRGKRETMKEMGEEKTKERGEKRRQEGGRRKRGYRE